MSGEFLLGGVFIDEKSSLAAPKKSELAAAVISPLLEKRVLFYGFNAAGSGGLPFTPSRPENRKNRDFDRIRFLKSWGRKQSSYDGY